MRIVLNSHQLQQATGRAFAARVAEAEHLAAAYVAAAGLPAPERRAARKAAQLEAARRRASGVWPTLDRVVVDAVRQRISQPDMAEFLDAAPDAGAGLAGRRTGTPRRMYTESLSITLPVDLVAQLRGISAARSQPALRVIAVLEYQRTAGALSRAEYRTRVAEAATGIWTPARIVREALEALPPLSPVDEPAAPAAT